MLLANIYFPVAPGAREHDRPVRRSEGARQQEASIEIGNTLLQQLVLFVKNAELRRRKLADEKQVAIFDLFRADAAKPFTPLRRKIKLRIRHDPEARRGCSCRD